MGMRHTLTINFIFNEIRVISFILPYVEDKLINFIF